MLSVVQELKVNIPSRHWPVFLAGTVTVIVFWLITPLQSAILGTGVVSRTVSVEIADRSQLLPPSTQTQLLSPKILNIGYAIGWLGQRMPPFTTASYATLPFYLDDDPASGSAGATWTANTTKYWTELECWPAKVSPDGPPTMASFFFVDGRGCNASISFDLFSNYSMYYVGYYGSPYSDFALENPACPKTINSTHEFLAIWSHTVKGGMSPHPVFNITALFCQPHYYQQDVQVSISSQDQTLVKGSLSPRSKQSSVLDSSFNTTAFEFLLGNGMTESMTTRDFPFNSVVEQTPRLDGMNLSRPASNMVGFALAGQHLPTVDYADPDVLHAAYDRGHRYLFSVAISQLLANTTGFQDSAASSSFVSHGIIVSRVFSATVEGLLLLVTICTVTLLWICHVSPSKLVNNPSSIQRLMDIFSGNDQLLDSFRSVDNVDEKKLEDTFRGETFQLSTDGCHGCPNLSLKHAEKLHQDTAAQLNRNSSELYYSPVRPTILRYGTGLGFILVIVAASSLLLYLEMTGKSNNGEPKMRTVDLKRRIYSDYGFLKASCGRLKTSRFCSFSKIISRPFLQPS